MKKRFYLAMIMAICSTQAATIYFKNTLPVKDENFTIYWTEFAGFVENTYKGTVYKNVPQFKYYKTIGLPKSITTNATSFMITADYTGDGCPKGDTPYFDYTAPRNPTTCSMGGATVIDNADYIFSFGVGGSSMVNLTTTIFPHKEE